MIGRVCYLNCTAFVLVRLWGWHGNSTMATSNEGCIGLSHNYWHRHRVAKYCHLVANGAAPMGVLFRTCADNPTHDCVQC